ncbi:MAG: MgtC/SapB family protein [Proteobacteria bacterium]|nr:MgtC/SapB family protein [Pseudomonadota bacterium]
MLPDLSLLGLASAIGLGLLIGVVRERAQPDPQHSVAGIRTHLMLALAGTLGAALGTLVLAVVLLLTGALAVASYLKSADRDPGLTGEVAMPVTALLAALAQTQPALAGGLSVVVAGALFLKRPLHQLVRERLSEQELKDALLLAAAALVVLPLLPETAVDPWGVLVPARLWRLVVLILAVGMAGHVALQLVGARWGLPLAGFLSGFASSTAAVVGFGHRAREEPHHVPAAAAGALFANLGSYVLFCGLVAGVAPALFGLLRWPLLVAGVALLGAALLGVLRHESVTTLPVERTPRAFRISHALLLAGLMGIVLLVSAWLQQALGAAGVVAAAAAVALVEVHAAAASLAQLASTGQLNLPAAAWGVVLLLVVSALAKAGTAFISGGRAYGWRVASGLIAAPMMAVGILFLF